MDAKKLNNISIEAYLRLLEENDQKYEFHDGTIYAMAGGSVNHGIISGNIFVQLDNKLSEKNMNCFPLNSDVKLHIAEPNIITFPDAMIVCGDIERSPRDSEAVTNPSVIIEVLSKSTESYDRGDKFFFYRQIPSLREYVLISQDKVQVDIFLKDERQSWKIKRYNDQHKAAKITSLAVEIDFTRLYRNVDFNATH